MSVESFERELFKRRKLKTSKNKFINEFIGFVLFANELLTFEILNNESIKQCIRLLCICHVLSYVILYAFEIVSALCHKIKNTLTCLFLYNPFNSYVCKTCAHVTPAQLGPRLNCLRSKLGAQSKALKVNALNYRHASLRKKTQVNSGM